MILLPVGDLSTLHGHASGAPAMDFVSKVKQILNLAATCPETFVSKLDTAAFMHYALGYLDHESGRLESAANPFAAKVPPMPSA